MGNLPSEPDAGPDAGPEAGQDAGPDFRPESRAGRPPEPLFRADVPDTPTDPLSSAQEEIEGAPRRPRWRSIVGGVVGVGLVVAALIAVGLRHQELSRAMGALAQAPGWMVILAFLLPLANWLLVSQSLWIVTARHGPVAPREMLWLVAGAWLLNYLPMRPGMVGRIAYHRAVNGIPVKTSMGLLVISMGLTGGSIVLLAVLGFILREATHTATEVGVIAGAGAVIGLAGLAFRLTKGPWRLAGALLLRYLDMLVWVARYWIMFSLVGQSLSFEQACLVAAISQAATAIPLAGNGLGLREWAVALFAASLPAWFAAGGGGAAPDAADPAQTASDAATIALAADLINRGVELLIAVPVGLTGLSIVTRTLRRRRRVPESPAPAPSGAGSPGIGPAPSPADR